MIFKDPSLTSHFSIQNHPLIVQSLSCVWLFVTSWTAAAQASMSFTISGSLLKLMSTESVMPPNHLILFIPFSSCPQSFPASGSIPDRQLFASGVQSIRTSASASVFKMNIQGWFPLGLTDLITLLSKGLSRVFSSPTTGKYEFFGAQPSHGLTLTSVHDYWKNHSFDCLDLWASLVAQMVKNLPAVQETWVQFLGWEDLLEKGMATHSSIFAWRIPWTEEPGRLQSMGLQRVRHDWETNTFTFSSRRSSNLFTWHIWHMTSQSGLHTPLTHFTRTLVIFIFTHIMVFTWCICYLECSLHLDFLLHTYSFFHICD